MFNHKTYFALITANNSCLVERVCKSMITLCLPEVDIKVKITDFDEIIDRITIEGGWLALDWEQPLSHLNIRIPHDK